MSASFVQQLFSTDGFMPHGMCYRWQADVLALHVISDGLIALAYFSISLTILYFVHKRVDLKHNWVFLCFVIFIAACGITHAMEIWTIWHPAYWLSGGIKAATAFASVSTAILLILFIPIALRLPTPATLRNVQMDMQREVNERSAIAADAAGLGFWSFDVAANALKWDESMFRLYGLPESASDDPQVLSASGTHPDDRGRIAQHTEDALHGKRSYDMEFRIVRPNGAVRHLKAVARITRDTGGRAIRVLGVTFDITERKQADEQFRLAIEAAPTGMLLMDDGGSIVLVNTQIENLFGYPRAEILGRPIEMLLPERFRADIPDFRHGLFKVAAAQAKELFGLRRDGLEVPIEIGLNPILTSQGEFVLCSIVDLSQRVEIDRIRNEFVSTVSHELRTPLTSISGSLGLLHSGAMGALPDKAAAMVGIAYTNSRRLATIINDILDVATLEAGKLTLQMSIVPLAELLQQAVEANAGFAEKCGVRFVLEPVSAADTVMADPDRLMQVVANLLSNAAKFSPPGADVLIRVRPGPRTTRIEVEDSGPGISEAFKARIFEKFAQAEATATRRFAGTGLGLNIARMLVERMGGAIGFSTVVDQGTVFYVELQRMDAAPTMLRSHLLSETAAHQVLLTLAGSTVAGRSGILPRLLYVEDDRDLISVIRATLAGRVEVVPAHSLQEAERLLREEDFELVILDQSLPDGNGISLIDEIRGYLGAAVPIIILCAVDLPQDVHAKVAAVLIKSQVSAAQVATAILSYLPALSP
jgi:PAS domain S-box-containing protein